MTSRLWRSTDNSLERNRVAAAVSATRQLARKQSPVSRDQSLPFAPTARPHPSLGQRPRTRTPKRASAESAIQQLDSSTSWKWHWLFQIEPQFVRKGPLGVVRRGGLDDFRLIVRI